LVVDVWATWCPPCKAMIPHERELVKRLAGKPFALLSISADDDKKEVADFIKGEPMPWDHWFNGPKGGVIEKWKISYFPTIYVLDGTGTIRYKGVRGKQMDEAVDALLAETGKGS
jgi:thiol-disulfide isomerase/thioredoxin